MVLHCVFCITSQIAGEIKPAITVSEGNAVCLTHLKESTPNQKAIISRRVPRAMTDQNNLESIEKKMKKRA